MKRFIAIALLAVILFASTLAPASAHSTCRLHTHRNGNVTVGSGPCYYHDFPAGCRVPARIEQGQSVPCRRG